ncbi:MAG: hypothetical protein ABID87_05160 [Chloroflexota bacterium]
MYDTAAMEEMNKPAIALCNEGFAVFGTAAAGRAGIPALRVVPENVPCECTDPEEVDAGISAAMDAIITALTAPLTPAEKSPKPPAEKLPRIAFKGNLEEVNRFFYKRGWGDGLPVLPPTEEAVAEMLKGTDLPPDHIVGELPPRSGKATVEKIAVNAVMAGALPTLMPVLIAGVEALLDPKLKFRLEIASAHSFAPFWVINGPLRNDLNMNSGSEALSPGEIANGAFGRAMGLIIKNIGGARKNIEDKGTVGNPMKLSGVLAENEEESPWEPLHVEQGLRPEDSAVSVFCANTWINTPPYGLDDKGILDAITANVVPGRRGLFCLVLAPVHARTMAKKGWTKAEIKTYITEYARVPAFRHPAYWGLLSGGAAAHELLPGNPNDSMRIFRTPDWIRIVVAGGVSVMLGMVIGSGDRSNGQWVTRKVALPKDWPKLVAKYRDVVPRYTLH